MSGPPPASLGLEATPRLLGAQACWASSPWALAATDSLVGPVGPHTFAFYQNGLVSGHADPGAGTRGVSGTLFPKMGFVLEGTAPQLPDIQGYRVGSSGDWLSRAGRFPAGPGRSLRGHLSAEQLQASSPRGGTAGAQAPRPLGGQAGQLQASSPRGATATGRAGGA